ncbi:MAG: hypothetical protein V3V12_00940 [Gammaproteobacteria bacterium]
MNKSLNRLLYTIAFTLVSSPVAAKDMDDQFAVYGVGAENCAAFLVARDQGGTANRWYFDWLEGYLSAVNTAASNTYNILGDKSVGDIVSWLEGYCATNPNMNFTNAVADLSTVLYEDRSNTSPNKSGGWKKAFTGTHPNASPLSEKTAIQP